MSAGANSESQQEHNSLFAALSESAQGTAKPRPSMPPRLTLPQHAISLSKQNEQPSMPRRLTLPQHAISPSKQNERPSTSPRLTLPQRAISLPKQSERQAPVARISTSAQLEAVAQSNTFIPPGLTLKQRVTSPSEVPPSFLKTIPTGPLLLETVSSFLETTPTGPLPEVVRHAKRPGHPRAHRTTRAALVVCAVLALLITSASVLALTGHLLPQRGKSMLPTRSAQSNGQPQDQPTAQVSATQVSLQAHATQATQRPGHGKRNQTNGAVGAGVSPYIFGTNLALFDTNDQFLNSAATRGLLQQMHVRMVRMPVRSSFSMSVEIQAAQAIKSVGAVPLVILRGSRDPNVVADDTALVQVMNQIFGNGPVYYEFGNEDDLAGINVTQYTGAWNTAIAAVKPLARNGRFIGPVNYQYNAAYLAAFLQNANPAPDMISWHEYTCSYKWAASLCISHIDNWTVHINNARSTMQAAIGQVLPIMITEWNYAPDQGVQANGQPFADGKYNNVAFMTTWTTKALQTLAANHVFASMQYSVTNTAMPLISSSGTITTQGATFQALYQQLIGT